MSISQHLGLANTQLGTPEMLTAFMWKPGSCFIHTDGNLRKSGLVYSVAQTELQSADSRERFEHGMPRL